MRPLLKAKLMGIPEIVFNSEAVSLPYKQAQAIIYYLLVHKKTATSTLADIIWGDKLDPKKVQANLTNALYIIRKHLGKDFILKEKPCFISINPKIDCVLDTEVSEISINLEDIHYEEFLKDFYLKDNELYNEWIESKRIYYRNTYIEMLSDRIKATFENFKIAECKILCKKLIAVDEFNEGAYRTLITICKNEQKYSEAMAIYRDLENLLKNELFETPSEVMRELAVDVEKEWNKTVVSLLNERGEAESAQSSFFCARVFEMDFLKRKIDELMLGKAKRGVVITGEEGIGKTSLVNKVLEKLGDDKAIVLKAKCYQFEQNHPLNIWQEISRQILSLVGENKIANSEVLTTSIYNLFPFLKQNRFDILDNDEVSVGRYEAILTSFINALIASSHTQPILIFIDDLQWADEASVSVIRKILLSHNKETLLFMMTLRNNLKASLSELITLKELPELLEELILNRFTYDETKVFAKEFIKDLQMDEKTNRLLYNETQGIPFFLTEAAYNIKHNRSLEEISPKLRNILQIRLVNINDECKKILSLISFFINGVKIGTLAEISGKEEYELADIIQELIELSLIREEIKEGDIYLYFLHQKMQEYVYDEMSYTKRRIMHNKIGVWYEKSAVKNEDRISLYSKLIYHFERAGNPEKYLRYAVDNLAFYLNIAHEYFPILEKSDSAERAVELDFKLYPCIADLSSMEKMLVDLEKQIDKHFADTQISNEEVIEIISNFYHMMGRYHIRKSNYDKGAPYIEKVKALNMKCESIAERRNFIKANRQLICVYINCYQIDKMQKVIEESLAVAKLLSAEDEAVWWRLQGMCDIMSAKVDSGITNTTKAIKIFESSEEKGKCLYSLAAGYAWIGEAYRQAYEYKKAKEHYMKAIDICSSVYSVGGICAFYAYAGICEFDNGNIKEAEEFIEKSIEVYTMTNLMWGRGLASCYHSMILLQKKEYLKAKESLINALGYAKELGSPYEEGVIYRVFAQIAYGMQSDSSVREVFADLILNECEFYIEKSKELLKNVYSPIDFKYLNDLEEAINKMSKT